MAKCVFMKTEFRKSNYKPKLRDIVFNRTLIMISLFTLLITMTYRCTSHSDKSGSEEKIPERAYSLGYSVTEVLPHDTSLFTEGLEFHLDVLFESTGSPEDLPASKSMIGISHLPSGIFEPKVEMNKSKFFGEGITILNNKLYQLTYKNQIGFVYELPSCRKIDSFRYANEEGWGLTNDGNYLIMSDGTAELTYMDIEHFGVVKKTAITLDWMPCTNLNELEYINGFIYANIWLTNIIVKIDAVSGKVTGKVDLSKLKYDAQTKNKNADVLNGIAYNPRDKKFYVTGKLWPNIYAINFY